MHLIPYALVIWLFLVGLYGIATSRNIIHLVNCLFITQSSTYLLLLVIGYQSGGTAPIYMEIAQGTVVVDPVVQALTLTDIVVGATLSALILVFAVQIHKRTKTIDPGHDRPMRG
jgi:multicomponent Na+:H+ antiporter subunit C